MQQPPASTLRQVCPLVPLPPGALGRLLRGSVAGPLAGLGMHRRLIRERNFIRAAISGPDILKANEGPDGPECR